MAAKPPFFASIYENNIIINHVISNNQHNSKKNLYQKQVSTGFLTGLIVNIFGVCASKYGIEKEIVSELESTTNTSLKVPHFSDSQPSRRRKLSTKVTKPLQNFMPTFWDLFKEDSIDNEVCTSYYPTITLLQTHTFSNSK